jgi:signal recognition particle subunit SRP54
MADAFKALSKNGGKGFGQMAKMLGAGNMDMGKLAQMAGGKQPSPEQLEEMAAKLKELGGPGGGGLPKLPGLGGGLPPSFNPFKK